MESQRTRVGYLLELMDYVCSNAAYSRFIDEKMLVEWRTYFDICQLIFAELSIKIIKIQENPHTSPAQKLQHLIALLYQELEVDELRQIDARQVLSFNLDHIHRLLEILYLYSKIYLQSKKPTTVVKSENEQKQKDKPAFSSARDNRKSEDADNNEEFQQSYDGSREDDDEESTHRDEPSSQQYPPHQPKNAQYPVRQEEYLIAPRKQRKKVKPVYSAQFKRTRSQSAQRKNLHEQIVNVMVGEKSSMFRASTRENRKSRLQGIKLAKDSYKAYLKRYTKENKATAKHNQHLKEKARAKPIRQQLPHRDFQVIDNFFESFAYKFRDKKANYLQRIQKLVHQQEQNRFVYQNRLEREIKSSMNTHLNGELDSMTYQHRVRSAMLRENSKALDQEASAILKAMKQKDSIQKRELKQAKRQELKTIENALRQENQKVLMSLEEGGQLQQLIMQIYKRF